jgi:hypothetical protein
MLEKIIHETGLYEMHNPALKSATFSANMFAINAVNKDREGFMKKSFIPSATKFCLLSLLLCQSALAFNKAGNVSITPGAGYDYFSSKRHMTNTGIPFGIVGYNFTDNWAIEGLLGFFRTTYHGSVIQNPNVDGTMFAVNAVYHFAPYYCFQPYVLAGPGAMSMDPNGTDSHGQGNFNAAVGVQIFSDEVVALRLEARDFYTFVGGQNDVFLNAGVTFLINT